MILLVAFFLLLLRPKEGLMLFSYALCFYKAFKGQVIYSSVFLFYIVVITIKSIIYNYKKFAKISKKIKIILILSFLYLFLQPIVFILIYKDGYYGIIKLYIFLISFILIFFLWDEINLKKFVRIFCFGIVASCLLALIGHVSGLINYNRLFMYDSADVMRFSGIFAHPNSLARFCLLGISLLFVLWLREKKDLTNYSLMFILAILGAMTYSKTYILALIGLLVFFFFYYLYHSIHKKQFLLSTAVVILGFVCVALLELDYIKDWIGRFSAYYGGNLSLKSITTGRDEIWKLFIDDQMSSLKYIIWGKSFMGRIPWATGAHSTYLALFYEYGVIGCIILIVFILCMFSSIITVRFRKIRLLPLFLILLTGIIGDQIFTHNGCFLWLIAFTALMEDKSDDYEEKILLTKNGEDDILKENVDE